MSIKKINGIPVRQYDDYIEVQYSPVLPNKFLKLTKNPTIGCTSHVFPNGFMGNKTMYYVDKNKAYVEMLLTSFILC